MSTLKLDLSKTTCRVCLQNGDVEQMSSIFDVDSEFYDLHIYEKIEQCADIKVLRYEEMPSLICGQCYGLLKDSYKFRTVCRNSNEYLLQFAAVDSTSPKITTVFEQNPLSITDNISEKNATRSPSNNKYDYTSPETIKNEEPNISQSPTHSKEFLDVNFNEEEWFDIDYQDDEDDISCGEIEVPTKETGSDNDKEIDELTRIKKPTKRMKKSEATKRTTSSVSSKSMEICSDNDVIKPDRKPRAKREKKESQCQICEICGNIYQRRSLELHMRIHRDEKPFACEICGNAFHSNFQLNRHMRKHTGDRPYKCSYCPRAFGDQSTLIKHERVHRNERPFKCETCGKCFSYTGVLKYHKLVHTGEKPYACEICGKCFPRAHKLRDHLKTLQHQSDPRTKILLQNIRRNNVAETIEIAPKL